MQPETIVTNIFFTTDLPIPKTKKDKKTSTQNAETRFRSEKFRILRMQKLENRLAAAKLESENQAQKSPSGRAGRKFPSNSKI